MGDVSLSTPGAVVVVHRARRNGKPYEPVGVWLVAGSDLRPYYPQENASYEDRGLRALTQTPTPSLSIAAQHLAKTSQAWSVWEPSLFVESLAAIWADVNEAAAKKRAHRSAAKAAELVHRGSDLVLVDEPSGTVGWGALRAVNAHSWWLASALVRRHPELAVYEMHPGGGQYDVLLVAPKSEIVVGGAVDRPRILLNRVGTIQVHVGSTTEFQASWQDSVFAPTPLATVIALERVIGLPVPQEALTLTEPERSDAGHAPGRQGANVSTERALTYSTLAALLAMQVHDRQAWDVRSLFEDSSGWSSENEQRIPGFPTAQEEMARIERTGYAGEPLSHFWRVTRGQESVAVVSDSGLWHRQSGSPFLLSDAFAAAGQRLTPMVAKLLGKWS